MCQAQEEIALPTPFGEVICPPSKWQGTLKPVSLEGYHCRKRLCFFPLTKRPALVEGF